LSKKEVISFTATIAPLADMVFSERVKAPGTLEGIRIRFYAGQELDLRVRPYVLHKGQKSEDVLTYPEGSNPYLSGDDDEFYFPVTVPLANDDEIKVHVVNVNTQYAYTLVVHVAIDYYGGGNRVI
jgi:hypothetical protein